MSLVVESNSPSASSYIRIEKQFLKTLRRFSPQEQISPVATPSYKNLPKLLKVNDSIVMTSVNPPNTEVSYNTMAQMAPTSAGVTDSNESMEDDENQERGTLEVSIDGNYEEDDDEEELQQEEEADEEGRVGNGGQVLAANSTSPATNAILNRPSVINLGLTLDTKTSPPIQSPLPTPDTPTHHHHSNGERPERMREWLVRMINSGRFPGLEWLDQEKMIFRVPWVHAKKRDYNQERDAALFKEWAIHSGKYGDGSDVTTWKINFRCALNGLKDIIERKDLEGPDCRIYQMLPSTSPSRRRKRRRPIIHYSEMMQLQTTPTDLVARDIRPKMDLTPGGLSALTPTAMTPSDTPSTPLSTGPIQLVPIVTRPHSFQFPIPVATIQSTTTAIPHQPQLPLSPAAAAAAALPKYYPVSYKPVSLTTAGTPAYDGTRTNSATIFPPRVDTNIRFIDHNSTAQRLATNESLKTPPVPENINAEHVASRNHYSVTPISSPISVSTTHQEKGSASFTMYPPLRAGSVSWPPTEFADNPDALTVRVMYGSITVHMETVDAAKGVRIYYGPLHCRDLLPREEEERLFGPIDSHQISLSPRHPSSLASEIFRTLKRGLVIDVKNNDIYATALCRAVVYCGSSPLKHSYTITKEDRKKVFDFSNDFLPSLKQSTEAKGSTYPKPYVIFSFGQPWGSDRSLAQNLITVIVTHCKALNSLRVRNVNIYDEFLYEPVEHNNIRIISPSRRDLEAEEFLNPPSNPVTPH